MANEKVKPTQRELVLAGTIENLVESCKVAVESRAIVADALEELAKIIRKSNGSSESLIASGSEELAAEYPDLFSVADGSIVASRPDSEDSELSDQAEQVVSSIFPDAPTRAWRDAVAKIISAPPSDGHLRTANGDRMFKILSWIVREVDFTQNLVWIDAHLRVLVPTHKDKQGEGDVYESLIFDKNLFAPQTDSPIIEYPKGGDLLSKDGPVYLANDWFPSLVCDRPVEVVTALGVEFDQFDLPDAPIVVAVEPPAEPEAKGEAAVAEAPEPKQDKEIQPGTKVKILHPDCLGRTGTTSWENCPFPNCLFVWVDSEDPVLRVGAIPIHKRNLAPLS